LRTEVKEIREFLGESGGSRSEDGRSFFPSESPGLIEIDSNVLMIGKEESEIQLLNAIWSMTIVVFFWGL
jgi:hypothetical protein